MNRAWSTALLFAVAISRTPLRLWAEEPAAGAPVTAETPRAVAPSGDRSPMTPPPASAEAQWRKDVAAARESERKLSRTGTITSLAGLTLLVAGAVRVQSAGSVPGCERNGNEIVCNSPSARDEADHRITQGRVVGITGVVTGLVGLSYLIGASHKDDEVDELERVGRRKGFKLSLVPMTDEEVQLVLSRSF